MNGQVLPLALVHIFKIFTPKASVNVVMGTITTLTTLKSHYNDNNRKVPVPKKSVANSYGELYILIILSEPP